jgi:branched-chain amino acid transport system permease protein
MADAIQVTINGLAIGLIYALLLLGILLVYQVSLVVNFSHGQFAMIGGLGSFFLITKLGFSFWIAVFLGIIVAAIIAAIIEKMLISRLPKKLGGKDLVLTLGIFLALTSVAENVLHKGLPPMRYPRFTDSSIVIFGAFLDGNILIALSTALLLFATAYCILSRTVSGKAIRAASEEPDITESLGWNVESLKLWTWFFSGAVAGIAGILMAVRNPVHASYMNTVLIKAFIAGIIGGLHRPIAPLIVAITIGVYENWIGYIFGAQYRLPSVFALALIVLVVIPRRFIQQDSEARA